MRREIERKEQERKKSPKVDFIAGGVQPGTVVPTSNMIAQASGNNSYLLPDRQRKVSGSVINWLMYFC